MITATQPTPHGNKHELTPAAKKLIADRAARAADALNHPQDAPLFPDDAAVQPPPKPTATFTIHALMDDFPFDVTFSGSAEQLAATVKRLRDLGAVPPTHAARAVEAPSSAPTCGNANCSRHGQPLEPSQHNGYYCKGTDRITGNAKGYCKTTAK